MITEQSLEVLQDLNDFRNLLETAWTETPNKLRPLEQAQIEDPERAVSVSAPERKSVYKSFLAQGNFARTVVQTEVGQDDLMRAMTAMQKTKKGW